MNKFQLILLSVFGFFIIAGVVAFSTFRGGSDGESLQPITIWGTVSQESFNSLISEANIELDKSLQVTYTAFREDEFNNELVEALAVDRGPDVMLLSQDLIEKHYDKLFVLPYESFSERDFKDRFIEEGELYLTQDGVLGFPFMVDPLVLYWNRTLFSNKGISQPPAYWDELFDLSQTLTDSDDRGNIFTSTVALGEFSNIDNAKEILTALIMQAGNPIVTGEPKDLDIVLVDRFNQPEAPAESALRFYTEFANPVKPVYSWNRSLPSSQEAFRSGDLALYLGFASELFEIQEKNPNLNYDVSLLPQIRGSEAQKTFGSMQAFAVLKNSNKVSSAYGVISILTEKDTLELWEARTGLPPVRRDMVNKKQTDAFKSVFYKSAVISGAFIDPEPSSTEEIFRAMVEDVTSGRERISAAVLSAQSKISRLLN